MRHVLAIVAVSVMAVAPTYAVSPPKSTKSEYLVTTSAGFVMSRGEGLRYTMNYELQKASTEPLYVIALFEIPEVATSPLRVELVVEAGTNEFTVQSPPIRVITHDTKYEASLELYADADHTQLLATHKQQLLFSVPPASEASMEEQAGIQIR